MRKAEEFNNSYREGLKPGDLVFVSYNNKVGVLVEITAQDLWKVKCKNHTTNFAKRFIRKPTEAEVKWYEAEKEAAVWLKKRQDELSTLQFKCYEGLLFEEEKKLLKEVGYFVYDLRNWDEGDGYNIEPHVAVNNIGNMVTNIDLTPYMNDGKWIGIDELNKAAMDELYPDIKELLEKGRTLHEAAKKY